MGKIGFLDDIDMAVIRGDEGKSKKKAARKQKTFTCADCGLNMSAQTPKMPVWGQGRKKILFVLDTPSQSEDESGEPWAGIIGTLVKEIIEDRLELSIKKDCWTTFAVRCCAKKNIKSPQCEACRKYLHQDIEELQPAVIIPVGYWAMIGVSGDILTGKSRGKTAQDWAGFQIPDQRFMKWICPTHDTYMFNLDSNKPNNVLVDQFVKHVRRAVLRAETPVKKYNYEKRVKIIEGTEILDVLSGLLQEAQQRQRLILSLDYETTGRKPHRSGHEIVSIGMSDGKLAWAFDYNHKNTELRETFGSLLLSKYIFWRVHNVQFEWLWSKNIFGCWPVNLEQDTILGVHVMNSQKRKGLKPNVYCMFGVAGYDDDIEEYISAPAGEEAKYGANAFNLMKQAPREKRLTYNALDALFTYRLADYIFDHIRSENWVGYKFLMESAINLVKAQDNGIRVDTAGTTKVKEKLTTELNTLYSSIQSLAQKRGWPRGLDFRPSASDDIGKLLYDIMGNVPEKTTPSGKPSTEQEVIERIKDPIVTPIMEWKKLQKLRDTYVNGLVTEVVDEFMHPFFSLYTVVTYRSSSDSFNFQNIPKRDKKSSKIIRDLMFPHRGHKLKEHDYKAIEVCVSACYNKDPNLIKYVSDPSTDMHRDTGIELFLYEDNPQDFSKFDRGIAKNKFVFPEFYGSYFEQCAPDLWRYCSKEARENMKVKGIRGIRDFTDHVREIERQFWEVRFAGYSQWKKDVYKFYLKYGYVDSYTGFRYYGPMSKNEVLNICIQGSAHHVLLRTFNRISEVIEHERLQSKQIGQIHDSMITSAHPDEEKYVDKMVWYHGTQEILDDFDWIIVPISIEMSAGEVDRPWSEVQEVGLLGTNGRVEK